MYLSKSMQDLMLNNTPLQAFLAQVYHLLSTLEYSHKDLVYSYCIVLPVFQGSSNTHCHFSESLRVPLSYRIRYNRKHDIEYPLSTLCDPQSFPPCQRCLQM